LTLVPQGAGGASIASAIVHLAPHSSSTRLLTVQTTNTEDYQLTMQVDGRKLESQSIKVSSGSSSRENLLLLNDYAEFPGLGELSKDNDLQPRFKLARLAAASVPDHWVGFGQPLAIAIGDPDFSAMRSSQFEALRDFAAHGGTLLFLSPEGVLAAADTPLASLLPVTPLRLRDLETGPDLGDWTGSRKQSRSRNLSVPLPFVESLPVGQGETTLLHDGFPLCRWQRYGLGNVGVLAVNPFAPVIRQGKDFMPLWHHLMARCQGFSTLMSGPAESTVDSIGQRLTGFSIPSVQYIARLLMIYFGIMLLVLISGFFCRRQLMAWLAMALIGIVATALILGTAYRQHRTATPKSASVVDFRLHAPECETREIFTTLYSRGDTRPTLVAQTEGLVFGALPATGHIFGRQSRQSRSPLPISRSEGRANLPRLHLPALNPRSFLCADRVPSASAPTLPVLEIGPRGPKLKPWTLPDSLAGKADSAFLILADGILPAEIRGGKCQSGASAQVIQLDTLRQDLQTLLRKDVVTPPALVFMSRENKASGLPFSLEEFSANIHVADVYPLVEQVVSEEISLPPASIRVAPNFIACSRTLYRFGAWAPVLQRGEDNYYALDLILPPNFARLQPQQLSIIGDLINPGGNVTFDVVLLPADAELKKNNAASLWNRAIKAQSVSGQTFEFRNLQEQSLVQPENAHVTILLRSSQKNALKSSLDAERVNRWQVNSIRASVSGRLQPPQSQL
jgi:hypothetical protein